MTTTPFAITRENLKHSTSEWSPIPKLGINRPTPIAFQSLGPHPWLGAGHRRPHDRDQQGRQGVRIPSVPNNAAIQHVTPSWPGYRCRKRYGFRRPAVRIGSAARGRSKTGGSAPRDSRVDGAATAVVVVAVVLIVAVARGAGRGLAWGVWEAAVQCPK